MSVEHLFTKEGGDSYGDNEINTLKSAAHVGCGIAMAYRCEEIRLTSTTPRLSHLRACMLERQGNRVTGAQVVAVLEGTQTPAEVGCAMGGLMAETTGLLHPSFEPAQAGSGS